MIRHFLVMYMLSIYIIKSEPLSLGLTYDKTLLSYVHTLWVLSEVSCNLQETLSLP